SRPSLYKTAGTRLARGVCGCETLAPHSPLWYHHLCALSVLAGPSCRTAFMRFATIQTASGRRSAVLRLNHYVDLHATDPSLPSSLRELLEAGPAALKAAERAAEQKSAVTHEAGRVKLLPPIPDPRKIVCVGLNYRDHAA